MVSFYFSPDYSGSAIQARNLSLHLQRRGLSPFILSANLSASAAHEVIDGIPVHRVPVRQAGALQIPSFWLSAARFLHARRREFDVIHAHGTLQHGVVSIVGRLVGAPTILKIAMAGSDLAFERQGRVNGSLNRLMVKRFDRYIATTRVIAEEMRGIGLDPARICPIPNGVDTATFAPASAETRAALRRDLALPPGPIVSCVAIINERKNIDGTLRMWRDVVARGLPGHLLLIGPIPDPQGAFYRGLLEFTERHGLANRVTFLGKRDPIVPYLQVSDAFLFPSRQEGMPNSVLEAMACAVPCLVSRSAGTEEIVTHGQDGFTLDADDERAFADSVARLIDDASLRRTMGAAARQKVETRFSLNAVADRYVQLYKELLDGRR